MYRYFYFYLNREIMISQLDTQSKEGWDFVAWIDEAWHDTTQFPGEKMVRTALFRKSVEQQKGDEHGG